MTQIRISPGRKLRAWCFDVESRPGPWGGGDFTWRSMLSIAGGWEDEAHILYLGPGFTAQALEGFIRPLRSGCLVVGHNAIRYDLPVVNGTLVKLGLEPLPRLLVHDTYSCLPKRGQAFSASLGNLAHRFGVEAKGHMDEGDWELVYEWDREALKKLKDYNIGDVRTTLELRRRLLDLGLLGAPKVWKP